MLQSQSLRNTINKPKIKQRNEKLRQSTINSYFNITKETNNCQNIIKSKENNKNALHGEIIDLCNDTSIHNDKSIQVVLNQSSYSLKKFGSQGKKKNTLCPSHKLIKDTPFAVDAFSYGQIPGVEVYFLTHFHSDHYVGLNKYFTKPIYCTKITAQLCRLKLNVQPKCLKILDLESTIDINGIKVTTVDANHCPGSVMLIFSLPCGKNILHCGDFRASNSMESYPIFWNKEIHSIHLDTTYCDPRYNFPTQDESISKAISIINIKKNAFEQINRPFSRLLIVCGTYTLGKEKFFLGIAKELGIDVWAPMEKNTILKIALGYDLNAKPQRNCQLHILPMAKIEFSFLDNYLKTLSPYFDEVLAFKPTGWELSKMSLIQKQNVTIYGVPYSEHSSFPELQRFVKFLKPQNVIPTVSTKGNYSKIQKYFTCWVGGDEQMSQKRVSDYFTKIDK